MATATPFQAEQLEPLGGDEALNLFRTMANHPRLLKRWLPFGGSLLYRNSLPERDRELVILRVAALCGSHYEWGQHVAIARAAGVSEEEILRLAAREPATTDTWSAAEQALLTACDQLVGEHRIEQATWDELADIYDTEQLVTLPLLVGHYAMLAGFLTAAGVQTETPLPRIGEV